jgi:hypothetical protein
VNLGTWRGKKIFSQIYHNQEGWGFVMGAKVNVDHAADTVIRRSMLVFLVHLSSVLTSWFSMKQDGYESSTYGSEFIATRSDMSTYNA